MVLSWSGYQVSGIGFNDQMSGSIGTHSSRHSHLIP